MTKTKENVLDLMRLSVGHLVGAAKNLVAAKCNPDQLGHRATGLVNAVQEVINSGKSIACMYQILFPVLCINLF